MNDRLFQLVQTIIAEGLAKRIGGPLSDEEKTKNHERIGAELDKLLYYPDPTKAKKSKGSRFILKTRMKGKSKSFFESLTEAVQTIQKSRSRPAVLEPVESHRNVLSQMSNRRPNNQLNSTTPSNAYDDLMNHIKSRNTDTNKSYPGARTRRDNKWNNTRRESKLGKDVISSVKPLPNSTETTSTNVKPNKTSKPKDGSKAPVLQPREKTSKPKSMIGSIARSIARSAIHSAISNSLGFGMGRRRGMGGSLIRTARRIRLTPNSSVTSNVAKSKKAPRIGKKLK